MTTAGLVLSLLVLAVAIVATVMVMQRNAEAERQARYRESIGAEMLPTRLQAYERFALYLERIEPVKMVQREQPGCVTIGELYKTLMNCVNQEFEHNIAMQIYLTENTWQRVVRAKDEVIKFINDEAKQLPKNASSVDLGREIIFSAKDKCSFYVYRALEGLRQDIQGAFVNR